MSEKRYKVHVQNKGWTGWLQEGRYAGTEGESLRLEAIVIEGVDKYRVHIENIGWDKWVSSGEIAGTEGRGLRIEAIEVKGKGINYRVHVENFGWMNWVMDGETAGTTNGGLRIEAFQLIENPDGLRIDNKEGYVRIPDIDPPKPVVPPKPPTNRLHGKKVCIDAGHGGSDPGAVGNLRESDQNLVVALRLGELLAAEGATVYQTRTADNHMYLSARTDLANRVGADILISVHHNGANSPDAHGSETICHPTSSGGLRLATLVLNGITNRLGTYRRRIIQRDDFMVTYSNMPAIISEASFSTNPRETNQFSNGGAELEAQGIKDGVLAYFG